MYISDLKIHGFKSFFNKEDLTFGEGITAIVGPNGCGKTNIVDAIRWVLGEQKYSILRSAKMEDVIFNGAKGLKPLSVSEVSLTVHNNKGKLPIEYNDIEIGRRVYRNGESEYYLNRVPCRLKDIHDLFVDTGMGADAYSVIELKMIEQILSETGDDRKRMFEEAAGINKYKSQRKSALRKFEATRQDLERIGDIILEVETKVHGLNLQLKRFKRHAKLTEDLKDYDLSLAYLRTIKYTQLSKPLQTKINEYINIRESKSTKESIHDAEIKRLNEAYKSQEKELSGLQDDLSQLEVQRDTLRQTSLVNAEKLRSADSTIERLAIEKRSNESKQTQLGALIKDHEHEIESLDPDIEKKILDYKSKKEAFDTVEETYKNAQSDLEKLQNYRWEEQRQLADKVSLLKRTESMIEEKTSRIGELKNKLINLESAQKNHSEEQKHLEKKKSEYQNTVEKQKEDVRYQEDFLSNWQKRRREESLMENSIATKIEGLTSQSQFYKELVATGEGLPQGARYILENDEDVTGILGMVADVFQTKDDTQAAIEVGLGDFAQCLIAKDRKTALATIDRVHKENAGRLMVIPLKEIEANTQSLKNVPKSGNVIGRGDQFVQTAKRYRSLSERLLGNLLVVKDLDSALADPTLAEWNLVNLQGTFAGRDYIIKNRSRSNQGVVGRKKKIERLEGQISSLNEKSKISKANIIALDDKIIKSNESIESLSTKLTELLDEESEIKTEIIRNHYRQSQTLETIDDVQKDVVNTEKTLRDLSESIEYMTPKIKKAEGVLEELKTNLETSEETLTKLRAERDEFHQRIQNLRIELLNLENKRDNLAFKVRTAKENNVELEDRQKTIEEEIASLEEEKTSLSTQIEDAEKSLQKVSGKIHHHRSVLEMKKQVYSDTYEEIEKIRALIRSEQQSREAILEELKQCEIQIAEYEQKIDWIREKIQDRYQTSIPENMSVDKDEETLEMAIQRVERGLEKIGPVNMAVQVEYEEESKRYDILVTQRNDLTGSEEHLRETIQKIDRVARKQFSDTFSQIKTNYEKLFALFFEGGKGSLALVGDPDPLESDIAIYAQPPGKRNQSLRMLSAGEKSLTAIALLFAIYQYKPSPYCILDEVDAPLDDVNIRKFTRVLRQFAHDTQFLVVTHNKLTMEAADYLYGVTMEKKGVSKLVSVKFES
ncbi:MAG: chromosome segregation protein SMC [Candidatus Marinimicrobia bacterium]|nr:chromosome segregation protein SMC [Candidatus Neomarinimicrobiota bacterium]